MDEYFQDDKFKYFAKSQILDTDDKEFNSENLDLLEDLSNYKNTPAKKKKERLLLINENYFNNTNVSLLKNIDSLSKDFSTSVSNNESIESMEKILDDITFEVKGYFVNKYFIDIRDRFLQSGDSFNMNNFFDMYNTRRKEVLHIKEPLEKVESKNHMKEEVIETVKETTKVEEHIQIGEEEEDNNNKDQKDGDLDLDLNW